MLFSSNQILQVSELTDLIKMSLENDFSNISVEGEISNFRPASSGHCYFTLKDKDAMLSAVMFRSSIAGVSFRPKDGQLVVAKGRISVYKQRGNYQIICSSLKEAGQGNLLQILEERKQKLAAAGLFDQDRKVPLPQHPKRVAVVTSPTGAAIRDILQVLNRRNSSLSVVILPAAVQGNHAAEEISSQIKRANLFNMADVLIVGRGGGSLEDLMPFNEEVVVQAVADSTIPVISAVGHEIDVALCDFAADLRAPTPSAAAELVTPDMSELQIRLMEFRHELPRVMVSRLDLIREKMRFFSPDQIADSLSYFLEPCRLRLDDCQSDLIQHMQEQLHLKRQRWELHRSQLESLSPLSLLERGFAYVSDEENKNIHSAKQLEKGQRIHIRFHQGSSSAIVEETNEEL